jgi:hypothetical protein
MRGFRRLLDWALEKAGGDSFELPARMLVPKRNTGFCVFPVPGGEYEARVTALRRYTWAAKHDWKLPRQVGVAVAKVGEETEIDWACADFPWCPDPAMDRLLAEKYPFRRAPECQVDFRYRLRSPQ